MEIKLHMTIAQKTCFFFKVRAAADLKGILAVHLQNANVCEKKGPELESVWSKNGRYARAMTLIVT